MPAISWSSRQSHPSAKSSAIDVLALSGYLAEQRPENSKRKVMFCVESSSPNQALPLCPDERRITTAGAPNGIPRSAVLRVRGSVCRATWAQTRAPALSPGASIHAALAYIFCPFLSSIMDRDLESKLGWHLAGHSTAGAARCLRRWLLRKRRRCSNLKPYRLRARSTSVRRRESAFVRSTR